MHAAALGKQTRQVFRPVRVGVKRRDVAALAGKPAFKRCLLVQLRTVFSEGKRDRVRR